MDGKEHYSASVFMYGATIRGINNRIVVPVWSADGTHSKVQCRGGGKVIYGADTASDANHHMYLHVPACF